MKNEKIISLFILFFFLLIFFKTPVYAQSSYVLPYPSSMPGSLSYKFHLLYESVSRYWYFGDFGKFNYSLKMADKYLVEAKTLFEYKQYLLGHKALLKSDEYFISILPNLVQADRNGKNTIQKKQIFREASGRHIESLEKMKTESPEVFNWQPEKELPTILKIKKEIEGSINIRKNYL